MTAVLSATGVFVFLPGCHSDKTFRPIPAAQPEFRFLDTQVRTDEGVGEILLRVTRPSTPREDVWARLVVVGGTATKEVDFSAWSDVFFVCDSVGYASIRILPDDVREGDETILVQVVDPEAEGDAAEPSRAEIIVEDDEYDGVAGPIRFPLDVGTRRSYDLWTSVGPYPPCLKTQKVESVVTGTSDLKGETCSVLDLTPSRLLLRQDGQQIRGAYPYDATHWYPGQDSLRYASLPWVLFDFNAARGTSETVFHAESTDLYDETDRVVSLGRVRAVVPAGAFENVALFEHQLERIYGAGWVVERTTTRYWIADGVGVIRARSSYVRWGTPDQFSHYLTELSALPGDGFFAPRPTQPPGSHDAQ